MKNRSNEITSWKPLTGWQKVGLRLLRRLGVINLTLYISIVILAISGERPNSGAVNVPVLIAFIAFLLLAAVTVALASRIKLARKKLELDGQTMVYWVRVHDKGADLVIPGESKFAPGADDVVKSATSPLGTNIKVCAPLRRGLPCQIWFRVDADKPWVLLVLWKFELVLANWGNSASLNNTFIRATDFSGESIEFALGQLANIIMRYAISPRANHLFSDTISDLAKEKLELSLTIARLSEETRLLETSLHTAIGAMMEGVNALRDGQRFARSRKDAYALARTLDGVLAAVMNASDPRRIMITPDPQLKKASRKETQPS